MAADITEINLFLSKGTEVKVVPRTVSSGVKITLEKDQKLITLHLDDEVGQDVYELLRNYYQPQREI